MKKLAVGFLFLFHFFVSYSQAYIYHPMPDTNAVWKFQLQDLCSSAPIVVCYNDYQYRVNGDTIISSTTYTKVYKEGLWLDCSQYCSSTPTFYSIYMGGMRNDTLNKRVYFRNGSGEILLYNFNLNIGDTTMNCSGSITAIDSVLVGSNFRKRFTTSNSDVIIEGVGSVASGGFSDLLQPYCGTTLSPNIFFTCFTDGLHSYPSSSSCTPIVSSVNNLSLLKNGIFVSPNPIQNEGLIKLSNESSIIKSLDIMSCAGNIVKTYQSVSTNKFKIFRDDLKPGLYIIKIRTMQGEIFLTKIIIL